MNSKEHAIRRAILTKLVKASAAANYSCARCGYKWQRPPWAEGYLKARCPNCGSRYAIEKKVETNETKTI
jgi:DNA-directed RNA polymerase subunit RPC12/RpoP